MEDSRRGLSSTPQSRKIMVIADPTRESAAALQHAFSHAEQDELILIHVENNGAANANANTANTAASLASEIGHGEGNFLEQMKRICEISQPKVRVHTECITMEGIKAAAILLHGCWNSNRTPNVVPLQVSTRTQTGSKRDASAVEIKSQTNLLSLSF
ncbi:unnamed protein product [Brassica oleracea]